MGADVYWHIYGDPPRQHCTEESAFGYGLAPTVAQAWEQALQDALPDGVREVRLRTSFVVGRNGGALTALKRVVRLGLGGAVGHGQQGFSWLHEADMNAIILRAITVPSMEGAYIVSAPNPVSNQAFMRSLRRAMCVPIGLPAAAGMVRIGAKLLFRTDPELALYGRYVQPARLLAEGYTFHHPDLDRALDELCQ